MLTGILNFAKTYWRILAVLAALAFAYHSLISYGNKRFNEGKLASDTHWVKTYNEKVDERNREINKLEKKISDLTIAHKSEVQEVEVKLNSLIDKYRAKQKPVPKTDSASTCVDTEGKKFKLYDPVTKLPNVDFGLEFQNLWNQVIIESKP